MLALLPRQRLGSRAEGLTRGGYANVLPRYFDVDVDAFVLDFACRDMADVGVLADLPAGKGVHAGVIDVRNLEVEQPDQVAERIRAVLAVIDAERVTLTTDCGMKQLPRTVAREKLALLAAGAAIVRGRAHRRAMSRGPVVWTPDADAAAGSQLARYMGWLAGETGRGFASYEDLWAWSVDDLEGFGRRSGATSTSRPHPTTRCWATVRCPEPVGSRARG